MNSEGSDSAYVSPIGLQVKFPVIGLFVFYYWFVNNTGFKAVMTAVPLYYGWLFCNPDWTFLWANIFGVLT